MQTPQKTKKYIYTVAFIFIFSMAPRLNRWLKNSIRIELNIIYTLY